jgi:hypothetical protein
VNVEIDVLELFFYFILTDHSCVLPPK